jgi:hypothetical protein
MGVISMMDKPARQSIFLSREDGMIYRIELPADASDRTKDEAKLAVASYERVRRSKLGRDLSAANKTLVSRINSLKGNIFCGSNLFYQEVSPDRIEEALPTRKG